MPRGILTSDGTLMSDHRDSLEPLGDEDRYRRLFEEMQEGFALHEIIVDEAGKPIDYRFLEVNPSFERQTGLVAAEIVGKTVHEVIPGIEPEWVMRYGYVALTGEPASFVLPASSLGRVCEVSTYSPKKGFFATVFTDVTERQHAVEALSESEERYRELYEQSPFGYQSLDADGRLIVVNDAWTKTLGYSAAEVEGTWFGDLLVPEQVDAFRERFPKFKAKGLCTRSSRCRARTARSGRSPSMGASAEARMASSSRHTASFRT